MKNKRKDMVEMNEDNLNPITQQEKNIMTLHTIVMHTD